MPLSRNEIRNRAHEKAGVTNDAQRVEFLFERHRQLTSLLPTEKPAKARKIKA